MTNQQPAAPQASSRRDFFQVSATAAAVGCAALAATPHSAQAATEANGPTSLIRPGDTVLFQGDSITDAGRDRKTADKPNQQSAMGHGYASLAAAPLLVAAPDRKLNIYNRGISGNKVFELDNRWQADCLDLKPNVLSILIGVNDIWHSLNGNYDGTVEKYETDYHALIARTKETLPDVKFVVCEPFVLRCGAVNDKWFPEFDDYRAAARRVSDKAGATFVPFQAMFDRAINYAPPEHWAGDGVHPTSAGASLMANAWLHAVGA